MSTYTFEAAHETAQRVNWRIDDILSRERELDFGLPFLPESLARVEALDFLDRDEKRVLNQIRAHAYLSIFGLVEEFILPFVLDHARPQLSSDDWRTRALLQFAVEEAKHIQLFKRFRAEFERGFGHRCDVIGPPDAIAKAVLAQDPLGVALAILHIEWMTQRHFTESVRDDGRLDPQFKSLLKHHWQEEAQHAKLDTLMVEALAEPRSEAERRNGVEAYLAIGGILDAGIGQQVEFDIQALERAIGRRLGASEREELRTVQLRANRWTYLGSGMTHPEFQRTLASIGAAEQDRVASVSSAFC
jgi:P-aminobenzoate N-oxygenase AurF